MTETTAPPPAEPTRLCQKCRQDLPLTRFDHDLSDQAHVCTRCLKAMGYRVKETA